MQYLGKVKLKVNLGGAFNLLCLAGAGAVTINSMIRLVEYGRASERHKLMKELNEQANEFAKIANDTLKDFKVKKDADDEDVEDFLK